MAVVQQQKGIGTTHRAGWRRALGRSLPLWLLLPTLLVLLGMQVLPSAYTIYLSLLRRERGELVFAGLKNYQLLLGGSEFCLNLRNPTDFCGSLHNTLVFVAAYLVLTLGLGMLVAILLNRRVRLTGLYTTLIFVPWVLSEVVAGTIWRWMFITDYGLLQEWLSPILGAYTPLANQAGAMAIVVAASAWHSLAFAALLLLAALQTVPRKVQESAELEGASSWQRFLLITLPLIRGPLLIVVLLLSIRSINSLGMILAITRGGPVRATNTLGFMLYQQAWLFGDFGIGAALAVLMFALNALFAIAYIRTLRRPGALPS